MPSAISRLQPSLGKTIYIHDLDSDDTDVNSYDAFGRLRVSDPANRFDVEFTYDKQPLLMEEYTDGTSSIDYNTTYRDVRLSIGDAVDGSYALFCSAYNIPYTPGCSSEINMTGTLDLTGIGGGSMCIFHKAFGVETVYEQEDWLYAPDIDGTDWTLSHIFSIDFQSLKVGRIRFALVSNGSAVLAHEIFNDNIRNTGYWEHPNLRPYWKIYNSLGNTISEIGYGDGTTNIGFRYTITANATATMSAICATVKSEGGLDLFDMAGFPCAASNYLTSKTVAASLIPLLSIKAYQTFNGIKSNCLVIPEEITLSVDNPVLYRLLLNPTLTNAAFAQVDSNSSVYKDTSATAVANGTIIDEDYVATGTTRSFAVSNTLGRIILAPNYDATDGDILTIAAIRTSNTSAATYARIRWREIR